MGFLNELATTPTLPGVTDVTDAYAATVYPWILPVILVLLGVAGLFFGYRLLTSGGKHKTVG